MISRVVVTTAVIILSLGGISASAQQEEPSAATDDIQNFAAYSPEFTLVELAGEYDLWVEAVLKRRDKVASERENRVIALISHDILISQDRVRELARRVALECPEVDSAVITGRGVEIRALFKTEIANLNSKEAIFRGIRKSTEFSQKYRLVGDYLDLVRRDKTISGENRAEAAPAEVTGTE